jgi:cytochrome c-type biogenesis protein CcmE
MKPKHQRLLFVVGCLVLLGGSSILILRAFKENLVFFFSPSELQQQSVSPSQRIRVGGLVASGSLQELENNRIVFRVTDQAANIETTYTGLVPALFREGQGVVMEGYIKAGGTFHADTILTKHDENYMPKEVADALKKSGRWREEP